MKGLSNFMIYGACLIVLLIVTVGMIPIDLFLFAVPMWLELLIAAVTAAALVLYLVKSRARTWRRLTGGILASLLIVVSLFCSLCNPYWNSYFFRSHGFTADYDAILSYREAKADIDYMMGFLKKDHPAFLRGNPSEITKARDAALEALSADSSITVAELYGSVQHILSPLGDAHTTSYASFENPHYLKYIKEMRNAGNKLSGINGRTLEALLNEKRALFCYEAESWALDSLKDLFATWEGLHLLGLNVDSGVSYTYQKPDGTTISNTYTEADFVTYDAYMAYYGADAGQGNNAPFVRYEIMKDKSLALLTLDSCRYNSEYVDYLNNMFTEVKDLGIRNVAVDLRENGGGSSFVANEFIKYLGCDSYRIDTTLWRFGFFQFPSGSDTMQNEKYTDLTFGGHVYVLTSSQSFSSAMMFAEYIGDNDLGTLIGETPGNAPSGYGDVAVFQTPNSGLVFQVSTKDFTRADPQAGAFVTPDVPCDSVDAADRLYALIDAAP